MSYEIKYIEKGEEKTKKVNIKLFSNYHREKFNDMMKSIEEVKNKWDRINDINSLMAREHDKEKRTEYKEEVKQLANDIKSEETQLILKTRFDLIVEVLEDNGIKDDDLYNFEWWNRKVDPAEVMGFLAQLAYKDLQQEVKKK